jgi:hypothetical protein
MFFQLADDNPLLCRVKDHAGRQNHNTPRPMNIWCSGGPFVPAAGEVVIFQNSCCSRTYTSARSCLPYQRVHAHLTICRVGRLEKSCRTVRTRSLDRQAMHDGKCWREGFSANLRTSQ